MINSQNPTMHPLTLTSQFHILGYHKWIANFEHSKFADRNCEGEKPSLIVSTPYEGKNIRGKLGDDWLVIILP